MIGEQLSKLRMKHNMTQEEFAERMDVSRQAVSKWELNKTIPDVNKILKMSELFQVSVDYLLKGTEVFPTVESHDENSASFSQKENLMAEDDITNSSGIGDIEEANIEEPDTETKMKPERTKAGLKISLLLICILLAGITAVVVKCMACQVWDKSDNKKTLVRVDEIYKQYSLADVSGYGENGEVIEKAVLLDTKGVRNGDYIYCYTNSDTGKILVNYDTGTLIVIMTIGFILIIILILLIRELKKE